MTNKIKRFSLAAGLFTGALIVILRITNLTLDSESATVHKPAASETLHQLVINKGIHWIIQTTYKLVFN